VSSDRVHVFIGGLHRSGTSLVHRCLAQHPLVSAFADTGVAADEGQHLQSVYPPANRHGGPGRFGLDQRAHLDETSPLAGAETRRRLEAEWSRHWDLSKPVLVEKSPPNLVRTRFLQALFPDARQIAVIRHPIAVAAATRKWSRTSYSRLIEHWLVCHERLEADARHLPQLHVIRYEDLVADPERQLADAFRYIGLDPEPSGQEVRQSVNDAYFRRWAAHRRNPIRRYDVERAMRRFEGRSRRFGYSLSRPDRLSAAVAFPSLAEAR
jgi:hypothetical protein